MVHDLRRKRKLQKLEELINEARYSSLGTCLHPEAPESCSGNIVRGHSVQKALLKRIMGQDNKVYTPSFNLTRPGGPGRVRKMAVRNASIFHGFCSKHDTNLFSAIENSAFDYTVEHAFLLIYRSIAKELFNKKKLVGLNVSDFASELSLDPRDILMREMLIEMQNRARHDVRDLTDIYSNMSTAITNEDYQGTYFYAYELDRIPDILCCGTILLGYDLNGNTIQNLHHTGTIEIMTYSLLGDTDGHGFIVFGWYGESFVNETFIQTLESIPYDAIPDTITRFVLQHSENYFAAPRWRDRFSEGQKSKLDNLLMRTMSSGPFPLTDRNGVDFPLADWKVVGKEQTNVTL